MVLNRPHSIHANPPLPCSEVFGLPVVPDPTGVAALADGIGLVSCQAGNLSDRIPILSQAAVPLLQDKLANFVNLDIDLAEHPFCCEFPLASAVLV